MTYRSFRPRPLAPLALALLFAACGSGESVGPPPAQGGDSLDYPGPPGRPDSTGSPDTTGTPPGGRRAAVFVSPGRLELAVGDSARLLAWTRTASGDSTPATGAVWASSDSLVALVSASGMVHARAAGSAAVFATVGDTSGSASVTVRAPAPTGRLVVAPGDTTLDEGRVGQLRATLVQPDGGSVPADSVQWSVEPRGVLYLSEAGRLMGRQAGVATVTARRGALSATARLTVRTPSSVGLLASHGSDGWSPWPDGPLGPTAGESAQLVPTVRDTGGRYLPGHRVSWSSSDPAVATVDDSGLVRLLRPGRATITLRSPATGATSELPVGVYDAAPPMYRYEGCGPRYGTCAAAAVGVLADDPASRTIRLLGWVENRAFAAPNPAHRSALLAFVSTGDFTQLWSGYAEYDCAGCNDDERTSEPRLSVIWSRFAGPYDARCAADAGCDSLRLGDDVDFGPAELPFAFPGQSEARYLEGRTWFQAEVLREAWDPGRPLVADQYLIGGRASGSPSAESIELRLVSGPPGAPEPLTAGAPPASRQRPSLARTATQRRAQAAAERIYERLRRR